MDGVDAGAAGHGVRHLLDAVLAASQHDNFDGRVHAAQKFLIVGDRGIDEDNLVARLGWQVGRNRLKQLLAVGDHWRLAAAAA